MKSIFLIVSLLIGEVSMSATCESENDMQAIISHENKINLDVNTIQARLERNNNLTFPLQEELNLLESLNQFELGQFLLKNKGLNGYWTAYVIIHGPKKNNLSDLEKSILHQAPVVKATQQRFKIFQQQLQKYLRSGSKIASIPCGLMDDLLGLDFSNTTNVQLIGIDLDPDSLVYAQQNANHYGYKSVFFLQKDAW